MAKSLASSANCDALKEALSADIALRYDKSAEDLASDAFVATSVAVLSI